MDNKWDYQNQIHLIFPGVVQMRGDNSILIFYCFQKTFHYKGRAGHPGSDWRETFLKRHNLSLKEATKLSSCRYNATKNPFIVNHYFDILEKTIKDLGIEGRPDLIWNVDESGLPHDPQKCRVISAKGQKTLQVTKCLIPNNSHVFTFCEEI